MKSYVEASRFPLTEINGIPIPRLILGHLPFIGESYQGPEKNQMYINRFSNVENTIKIPVSYTHLTLPTNREV